MEISSFPLIDTHAHLCDSMFDRDRSDILRRAQLAGIEKIISVSEDLVDAKNNLELAFEKWLYKK